ncbi:MAG: hypothetical protein JOZ78_04450 [Chroococcidiopsidaceae cyanobacterium CP_BM_ER_R8_30]|nr:hypothetical protein [Chroococcidiopsidaceae cyanobacterium CP_BM_ER_R8_30]
MSENLDKPRWLALIPNSDVLVDEESLPCARLLHRLAIRGILWLALCLSVTQKTRPASNESLILIDKEKIVFTAFNIMALRSF